MKILKIYKLFSIMIILLLFSTSISANILTNNNKIYNQYNEKDLFVKRTSTSLSLENYDLLIIAPSRFNLPLNRLVNHKNNVGINTILVNVEEIYDKIFLEGRDCAEKVKYFIKYAIENWGITYVLLVGGRKNQGPTEKWWVPVRYSNLDRRYDGMVERKFLTDLYFADIYDENGNFSSWDSNNNTIFGEWPEDEIAPDRPDLYPDVYVGRLPCINVLEVRRIVRKIIRYETGKFDDSWFKNMVVVAGDTYPEKTDYIDGEVYTQMGLDIMSDFNPIKLWTSDGSLTNWRDVVKAINKGCGFVWFSGHGNPKLWATHPPNDSSTWIYGLRLRNIPFLLNRKKLPVCITGSGCFNSMFNVSLLNSPRVYGLPTRHCFSWALTIKRNGGSIATIGSTGFSYESPDINSGEGGIEWLDMNFFRQYSINSSKNLGDIWGNTVKSFLQNFSIDWDDSSGDGAALIVKNVQQWLLIGDPSLKIGGY